MPEIILKPGSVTLADLERIYRDEVSAKVDPSARAAIDGAAIRVQEAAKGQEAVYGVNTGFGALARTRVAPDQIAVLQERLVLSHCAGTGPDLAEGVVRLAMLLKAATLAQGYSGVRPELAHSLIALINAGVIPCVPAKGSVGASGDLAPLAHIAAALIGAMGYGTYEFTNLSTLKDWTWRMVATDFTWGTLLTGTSATVGVAVARWWS